MESQTGYFTANWVESRKNNRFRSIVNNDFNAGSSFQCTDIATFTSDNTSFDFIRLDMEYCNGILNSRFCSYPLDRLYYNTFRFLVSSQFRIIHDVVDIGLGLCLSFLFQWFHQAFFCLFGGQSGDCFQLLDFLLLQFVKLFFFLVYNDKLRFQILFDSFGFHLLALNFFLALSEYHFALFQLVFRLLNLLISECYLFF